MLRLGARPVARWVRRSVASPCLLMGELGAPRLCVACVPCGVQGQGQGLLLARARSRALRAARLAWPPRPSHDRPGHTPPRMPWPAGRLWGWPRHPCHQQRQPRPPACWRLGPPGTGRPHGRPLSWAPPRWACSRGGAAVLSGGCKGGCSELREGVRAGGARARAGALSCGGHRTPVVGRGPRTHETHAPMRPTHSAMRAREGTHTLSLCGGAGTHKAPCLSGCAAPAVHMRLA